MIEDGELGAVHRVIADLSFGQDIENTWGTDGAKHRMVNPDLAGGAMLDRKSYPCPALTLQPSLPLLC